MKLILGNGKTAQSMVRFLRKEGVDFEVIADTRLIKNMDVLMDVDEIFISPGVPQTQDIVIQARAQNIPITSDIELFSRHAKAPIIGITGSNGKSTVTQLLGEMIANDGKKVAVGGNIGTPALDCLAGDVDYYVLELSSYQLDYTQTLTLLTGVVLNITPDHLDRYEGFEHYKQSKLSLHNYCQQPIFNLDEAHTPNTPQQPIKPKGDSPFGVGFSLNIPKNPTDFGTVTCHGSCYFLRGDEVLMDANEAKLIGEHNKSNILAAFALGTQIGLNIDAMVQTVKQFSGLAHRLEWVRNKGGIDYYNDSKATNTIATITAINALSDKYQNICLIIGGIQKDEDYAELFALIDAHIPHVVLIGQSAEVMAKDIKKAQVHYADSMQSAVKSAQQTQVEAILLSPACASFDMFDNFEHRGDTFKQSIGQA